MTKGSETVSKEELSKQLIGTWSAVRYPFEGKAYTPTQSYKVSFDGKSIGIQLSVNSCGGEYTIPKAGTIQFGGNTFCTEACCDNEESAVLSTLFVGELNYSINENVLTIKTVKGDFTLQKNID